MRDDSEKALRTGFTTGACATAAVTAAYGALIGRGWADPVTISLPRGGEASFPLCEWADGPGWARAAVTKDAGDDPDVTHGARVCAEIRPGAPGIAFRAGEGVGIVTRPGLPIAPGEPAINPVPREMMTSAVTQLAEAAGQVPAVEITISIPGGLELSKRTWNPRLGIEGGLSILGTTGIVRPFSCAAWIASIHRGVDVARAAGLSHVVGATGATSETTAQARFGLPDHAMLDMGDFAGGLLKYLRRHPVPRLTIAGGFGKLTKLAQGALDLHSARSQVDFAQLARLADGLAGSDRIGGANTAMQALDLAGPALAARVALEARATALRALGDAPVAVDVIVIDRSGRAVALADAAAAAVL